MKVTSAIEIDKGYCVGVVFMHLGVCDGEMLQPE